MFMEGFGHTVVAWVSGSPFGAATGSSQRHSFICLYCFESDWWLSANCVWWKGREGLSFGYVDKMHGTVSTCEARTVFEWVLQVRMLVPCAKALLFQPHSKISLLGSHMRWYEFATAARRSTLRAQPRPFCHTDGRRCHWPVMSHGEDLPCKDVKPASSPKVADRLQTLLGGGQGKRKQPTHAKYIYLRWLARSVCSSNMFYESTIILKYLRLYTLTVFCFGKHLLLSGVGMWSWKNLVQFLYSLDEYKKTVWKSTQTIFLYSIFSLCFADDVGKWNRHIYIYMDGVYIYMDMHHVAFASQSLVSKEKNPTKSVFATI